ncbi:OprO/OprP family phosphate-selective porin [Gilvimarinus agarilyticus]|uniref:porin n=1 Tax=unclassified Gilvimarinus TaxID=2642066 RepID=UPI001C092AE4|nr:MULTISPECIES: porin [unclassified Gilvimarinus]MBU2886875.1 OprO/OprP family phosphate-selective porin [Gilvimarinus agarilyticus]MDO6571536.1 porin [Gilvimarinus sp. 2_MG-2023]MDO6747941.1 porin [Gilvimarinus sp. 1_MG-2023]
MTKLKQALLMLLGGVTAGAVHGETQLSAGVWGTYQYLPDDKANSNSGGEFTGEALILYLDGHAESEGRWLYSAEFRVGPGSFTDTANNSTGDQYTLHKAWVGWQFNDSNTLRVGKSQVPFGWKTSNFWPGDILLAGYGDQMDVGLKLSGEHAKLGYDLAYYHADDWGDSSTDTVDDNGHWGSSVTYRKVQTLVGNATWEVATDHKLGVSVQSGGLQDLSGNPDRPVSGDHQAAVLYYEGSVGNFFSKASWITQERDLPDEYGVQTGLQTNVKNQRFAAEVGYNSGPWSFYLDASAARPQTTGNNADDVVAVAPGMSYNYGPGWIYLEYLNQDGYVDRNGWVGEGDFEAVYLSLDFYL